MDLLADRGRRVASKSSTPRGCSRTRRSRRTAQVRRHADRRRRRPSLRKRVLRRVPAVIENEVIRQLALAGCAKGRGSLVPTRVGFQDMGGRITRYPLRSSEKTEGGKMRDVELGHRWMDAMSVDYSCLFPTLHARRRPASETRWRSSCAGPTTAGSPRRRCRKPTAASTRCWPAVSDPDGRCARSRPSATARASRDSWSLGARPAGASQPAT